MAKTIIFLFLWVIIFSCSMPGDKNNTKIIRPVDSLTVLKEYIDESDLILTDTIIDHKWDNDTSINGRKLKEVKKVLSKKDFTKLQQYRETLPNGYKRVFAWEILRDVTPTYREGIFYFDNLIPDKTNPDISTVYTFRVVFIVSDNKLIYYEIGEKQHTSEPLFHFTLIDKYKNDVEFNNLKNKFREIYSVELKEKELFIENIIYGENCGIAAKDPKEKEIIDEFVKNRDKEKLLKWLRSTNTEKQIYALAGFSRLNSIGIKPSEYEMKIIDKVLGKKGSIKACHGCIIGNDEIIDVIKDFKF